MVTYPFSIRPFLIRTYFFLCSTWTGFRSISEVTFEASTSSIAIKLSLSLMPAYFLLKSLIGFGINVGEELSKLILSSLDFTDYLIFILVYLLIN